MANSHCYVCNRPCGSLRRLQDYYCMWCKHTVSDSGSLYEKVVAFKVTVAILVVTTGGILS